MNDRVEKYGLQVAKELADFIDTQALPGSGVDVDSFWAGFSALLHDKGVRNTELLEKRESLQRDIDAWHIANRDKPFDREQ